MDEPAPILWRGAVYDPSGYGDELRGLVLGLEVLGVRLALRGMGRCSPLFWKELEADKRDRLERLLRRHAGPGHVCVIHFPAEYFHRSGRAARHVGRLMFETEGLPATWVDRCNAMDEIWVPTEFNRRSFREAGVHVPVFKVPGGVDVEEFRPGRAPLPLAGARGTVFLSMFEWGFRKGWDVLLTAWARAFHPDDDVSLFLRTHDGSRDPRKPTSIGARLDAFLAQIGRRREQVAPIHVLAHEVREGDLPALFAAASAYVAPSRGEGWGRPHLQGMACGLPVIATRWSGNREFMDDDNSLLIDIDGLETADQRAEIPVHRGLKWARPSVDHLVAHLRRVASGDPGLRRIGERARSDVEGRWTWGHACRIAAERLEALRAVRYRPRKRPLPVWWDGPRRGARSFAVVNRALTERLLADPRLALAADATEATPSQGRVPVWVSHRWPPPLTRPPAEHWVVFQHWEWESLPVAWAEAWRSEADEIWVASAHVRDAFLRAGFEPDRVVIIPLGIDGRWFRPDREPLPLRTRKRFRFLFVGSTVWRKGIDVLLTSYLRTFKADDDVCLVVKDGPREESPEGSTGRGAIEACQALRGAPEIEYLPEVVDEDAMGRLYAACDCLVAPYRAEGFALPVLEAMACGLPVIVTGYGAVLDYCRDDEAYLIPARRVERGQHRVGDWETLGPPACAEPDRVALCDLMRSVVGNPDDARKRAYAAARRIHAELAWDLVAGRAAARLLRVAERRGARTSSPARASAEVLLGLTWQSRSVHLRAFDRAPVEALARLLALPLHDPRPPGVAADVTVREDAGGFVVSGPSVSVWCATFENLLIRLANETSAAFRERGGPELILHAAGFAVDGQAVLGVGPSRAGKSSLAFAAWQAGLPVIGDDLIAIEAAARTVPFPRPLTLRFASGGSPPDMPVPAQHRALGTVDGETRLAIGRGLPGMVGYDEGLPVGHLILLERRTGAPTSTLRPASDTHATLSSVLESGAIAGDPDLRIVRFLRGLWSEGRVSVLAVGDHDWAGALRMVTAAVRRGGGVLSLR